MRQDLFSLRCGCGMAGMPPFLGCAWRMDNAFLVRMHVLGGGVGLSPQAVTVTIGIEFLFLTHT